MAKYSSIEEVRAAKDARFAAEKKDPNSAINTGRITKRNYSQVNPHTVSNGKTASTSTSSSSKTVQTPELDAAVGNAPEFVTTQAEDFVAPSSKSENKLTNEEQALEIMGLLNPVDFSPEAVAQREWENAGVKNSEEYRKVLPGIVQKDINDLDYFLFGGGALLAAESGLANTASSLAEAGRAINDFVTKPTPLTEALSAGYAPYVDKSKDVSKKVSDYLLGFADEQAQTSQGAMDIAKSNVNGTVGEVLLDATAAGSQMVGDIVISGATGGSTKIPMALRSFGAGVQQARNKGYTAEQQIAMGLTSAAIEYITEKFFGGNPFYDKAEAGMINETIKWLGGNEQLLSFLSSTPVETLNEGLEEILSGVLNPAMEYIIAGQSDPIVLEELLKEGIIGVMLGGAGQAVNAVANRGKESSGNPLYDALTAKENAATGEPATAAEELADILMGEEPTVDADQIKESDAEPADSKRISDYVEYAISKSKYAPNPLIIKEKVPDLPIGEVSTELAAKVMEEYGIDISGRQHVLRDNDIRHMYNSHGPASNEADPLFAADIKMHRGLCQGDPRLPHLLIGGRRYAR